MTTEPVLRLVNVSKTYGSEPAVHALQDVSLDISAGELIAIVGPSGSGKSTLLQLMGTLDRPTSGQVIVAGNDTALLGDRSIARLRAHNIGFVFQQFFLEEHMTVLDNVADGMLYAGVPLRQRRERAAEALESVSLDEKANFRPTQLSGGQRQRVAIARAIAGNPAVVLADEPTGNLDSKSGAAVLALLEGLNQAGTTIVVITHDRDVAARLPRQIAVLDGHIIDDQQKGKETTC